MVKSMPLNHLPEEPLPFILLTPYRTGCPLVISLDIDPLNFRLQLLEYIQRKPHLLNHPIIE